MGNRIGFVGMVLEDVGRSAQVNRIISEYADMVTGRIGVPNQARGIAVIGLLVEGTNERVGALTGRLGNVPGVRVKSALTASEWPDEPAEA
ncbi:MAG: iron-only hydrogenase system regulator [Oscillospiraceae bacterium]|jgi:putative iron-only hydrogenase system regulator|nr:iron-only hydrogenase system regulator [Oscillospiraceae bacterium]